MKVGGLMHSGGSVLWRVYWWLYRDFSNDDQVTSSWFLWWASDQHHIVEWEVHRKSATRNSEQEVDGVTCKYQLHQTVVLEEWWYSTMWSCFGTLAVHKNSHPKQIKLITTIESYKTTTNPLDSVNYGPYNLAPSSSQTTRVLQSPIIPVLHC